MVTDCCHASACTQGDLDRAWVHKPIPCFSSHYGHVFAIVHASVRVPLGSKSEGLVD